MDHCPEYRFTCEFQYRQRGYIAYICPFYDFAGQAMPQYNIGEQAYLVHLFSMVEGFKSFEMYPDWDFKWRTNTSESLVDRDIVKIIACVLANVSRH